MYLCIKYCHVSKTSIATKNCRTSTMTEGCNFMVSSLLLVTCIHIRYIIRTHKNASFKVLTMQYYGPTKVTNIKAS